MVFIPVKQLSDDIKRKDTSRDFLMCTLISSLSIILALFMISLSTLESGIFLFLAFLSSPFSPFRMDFTSEGRGDMHDREGNR